MLTAPPDPISEATRNKIQQGMTAEEVEAVVGIPAGNYTGNWLIGPENRTTFLWVQGAKSQQVWTGKHGQLKVFFDADGKVMTTFFFAN
jgi:hypothetical protein